MPEKRVVLRNTEMSVIEEVTEGTPVAETADSALLLTSDGAEFNVERDLVENTFMTGSLSHSAPQAGMWSDDLGPTIPTLMRGKGILTKPDWSMLMKSIIGSENQNTNGTITGVGTTTTHILIASGGDPTIGQLVYFPTQSAIRRVTALVAGTSFDVWPPLPTTPADTNAFVCGTNWQLVSEGHPSFTAYTYFDGPKRLRYAGCKATNLTITMEVGTTVPMVFACKALTPTFDNVAQVVTPTYDHVTVPLMCLGIDMNTVIRAVATGTPTTTETILTAPPFDVAINDKLIANVGAGVYETVNISAVSGDAGSNITLTHDALSSAVNSGDTVYVSRDRCAMVGDTMEFTVDMPSESEMCMQPSSGRTGRDFVDRLISVTKTPYFKSWQEILMRDAVLSSELLVTLGDDDNNIVSIYLPAQIISEVSLTADPLMKYDTTSQAVIDSILGVDHEIVIGAF